MRRLRAMLVVTRAAKSIGESSVTARLSDVQWDPCEGLGLADVESVRTAGEAVGS